MAVDAPIPDEAPVIRATISEQLLLTVAKPEHWGVTCLALEAVRVSYLDYCACTGFEHSPRGNIEDRHGSRSRTVSMSTRTVKEGKAD